MGIEGDDPMGKQPELPEFVRDLEIVQTLNRMVSATASGPQPDPDESDESSAANHSVSN